MSAVAHVFTAVLDFLETYNGAVTAIATVFIGLFTYVLAHVTKRQARLTKESINFAREALNLARAEFISTHRPRIILRDVHKEGNDIFYILVNVGNTPATITESWRTVESIQEGESPRPLRSSGYNDLGKLIFAGGEIKDLTYPIPDAVGFNIAVAGVGVEGLYFTGSILYSDEIGNCRRSVFRRRWDHDRKGFYRLDDPDQEYAD